MAHDFHLAEAVRLAAAADRDARARLLAPQLRAESQMAAYSVALQKAEHWWGPWRRVELVRFPVVKLE